MSQDCRNGMVVWGALQNDSWGPNINRERPEAGAGEAWDVLSTQESHTESLGSAGAEKPMSITSWLL